MEQVFNECIQLLMMDDGELSYIREEEYTEEIWDEIERQRK